VLPEGFRSLHDPAYEIATTHDKSQAFAGFHVVFAPPSPELEQRVAHAVLAGVRKTLGASGQVVTYRGDGTQHVRGGVAHVMNWNATLGARLQLAFVPACHGRATVVEQLAWGSYAGGEAIDRWLAALSLPDEDSPACLHLQRVHDD